jgi:2-polyprenyl-6-methoxyphenol hydroxylase-like FAD-dependent oxidoreductase
MVGTGVVNGSANVKQDRLRVVIVGGSVAGLTLAHCLHHNNIDFVVLEAGKEIAPQLGASIVVLPNGARILDQLGIFDEMTVIAEPLETALTWTGDGKLLIKSDAPRLCEVRYAWPKFQSQRCMMLISRQNWICSSVLAAL